MTSMGMRHPYVVPWAPDLIEAYVRTDRMGDAKELLDEFQRSAQRTGNNWARAAAARCAGLLSTGRASLSHFEQALRLHSAGATPFEEARTRLCLAETLLTTSDVSRARTELRNALAVFGQLGARPWGEAARRQLRLCGDQVAGPAETPIDRLTAQELKVALTVAQGATNKAAAESLFLSPKTVEFHLGNVYHKLGLSSRGS
jgi:DNA-binding CsgD family transcriptional regulator